MPPSRSNRNIPNTDPYHKPTGVQRGSELLQSPQDSSPLPSISYNGRTPRGNKGASTLSSMAVLPPHLVHQASLPSDPTLLAEARKSNHISRPPNSFMIFRSYKIKEKGLWDAVKDSFPSLNKYIASVWNMMSDDDKAVWAAEQAKAKAEHQAKYPDYRYKPIHGRKKSGKKSAQTTAASVDTPLHQTPVQHAQHSAAPVGSSSEACSPQVVEENLVSSSPSIITNGDVLTRYHQACVPSIQPFTGNVMHIQQSFLARPSLLQGPGSPLEGTNSVYSNHVTESPAAVHTGYFDNECSSNLAQWQGSPHSMSSQYANCGSYSALYGDSDVYGYHDNSTLSPILASSLNTHSSLPELQYDDLQSPDDLDFLNTPETSRFSPYVFDNQPGQTAIFSTDDSYDLGNNCLQLDGVVSFPASQHIGYAQMQKYTQDSNGYVTDLLNSGHCYEAFPGSDFQAQSMNLDDYFYNDSA